MIIHIQVLHSHHKLQGTRNISSVQAGSISLDHMWTDKQFTVPSFAVSLATHAMSLLPFRHIVSVYATVRRQQLPKPGLGFVAQGRGAPRPFRPPPRFTPDRVVSSAHLLLLLLALGRCCLPRRCLPPGQYRRQNLRYCDPRRRRRPKH